MIGLKHAMHPVVGRFSRTYPVVQAEDHTLRTWLMNSQEGSRVAHGNLKNEW